MEIVIFLLFIIALPTLIGIASILFVAILAIGGTLLCLPFVILHDIGEWFRKIKCNIMHQKYVYKDIDGNS